MKILKLANNLTSPAVAYCGYHKDSKKNEPKLAYYIKHGSFGDGLWALKLYLHKKSFLPKKEGETISLTGSDYNISVLRNSKKEPLLDSKENNLYIVTKDKDCELDNTVILLWDIPCIPGFDMSYEISGHVNKIGEGTNGRARIKSMLTAPAPLLEIKGDCTLKWIGTNEKGAVVSRVVNYIEKDTNFLVDDIVNSELISSAIRI